MTWKNITVTFVNDISFCRKLSTTRDLKLYNTKSSIIVETCDGSKI